MEWQRCHTRGCPFYTSRLAGGLGYCRDCLIAYYQRRIQTLTSMNLQLVADNEALQACQLVGVGHG